MTYSSSTDAYPRTPTLSFRSASFTSDYLTFTGVEETTDQPCHPGAQGCSTNGYQVLKEPTSAQQQLLETYDPGRSIPFLDLGGASVLVGASYDPQVLAGQTPQQVARWLGQPQTAEAKQIGAAAAALTRSLCQITDGQPLRACSPD